MKACGLAICRSACFDYQQLTKTMSQKASLTAPIGLTAAGLIIAIGKWIGIDIPEDVAKALIGVIAFFGGVLWGSRWNAILVRLGIRA